MTTYYFPTGYEPTGYDIDGYYPSSASVASETVPHVVVRLGSTGGREVSAGSTGGREVKLGTTGGRT